MKLFTPDEANALLPEIVPKLTAVRNLYERIQKFSGEASLAASASEFGGGMQGGTDYVKALYEVGKLTTEIAALDVEIKDPSRGLIDFPSMRGDRVVLLCWHLGDGDRVEWWHEAEAGFAGRQPL